MWDPPLRFRVLPVEEHPPPRHEGQVESSSGGPGASPSASGVLPNSTPPPPRLYFLERDLGAPILHLHLRGGWRGREASAPTASPCGSWARWRAPLWLSGSVFSSVGRNPAEQRVRVLPGPALSGAGKGTRLIPGASQRPVRGPGCSPKTPGPTLWGQVGRTVRTRWLRRGSRCPSPEGELRVRKCPEPCLVPMP